MALQSGSSHAAAALASLVSTEMLMRYFAPAFPLAIGAIERVAARLALHLREYPGAVLQPEALVRIMVAAVLAFSWGAIYHWSRHGDE